MYILIAIYRKRSRDEDVERTKQVLVNALDGRKRRDWTPGLNHCAGPWAPRDGSLPRKDEEIGGLDSEKAETRGKKSSLIIKISRHLEWAETVAARTLGIQGPEKETDRSVQFPVFLIACILSIWCLNIQQGERFVIDPRPQSWIDTPPKKGFTVLFLTAPESFRKKKAWLPKGTDTTDITRVTGTFPFPEPQPSGQGTSQEKNKKTRDGLFLCREK